MKKSTVYLLLVIIFLSALATYFALQSADFSSENQSAQATVSKLRTDNRKVYSLEEQVRVLEKINHESLEDGKALLEEKDSLKNSLEAKDNDLAKMKLFSDEAMKNREAAERERARTAQELEREKKRSRLLEKELEAEKKRYDELNGELVRSRQLIKDIEGTLATREQELENLKDDYFAVESELKITRERVEELEN